MLEEWSWWGKSGARGALVVHVLVFAGRNAISLPMYGQLKSRCHVKVDASMDVRKEKVKTLDSTPKRKPKRSAKLQGLLLKRESPEEDGTEKNMQGVKLMSYTPVPDAEPGMPAKQVLATRWTSTCKALSRHSPEFLAFQTISLKLERSKPRSLLDFILPKSISKALP